MTVDRGPLSGDRGPYGGDGSGGGERMAVMGVVVGVVVGSVWR